MQKEVPLWHSFTGWGITGLCFYYVFAKHQAVFVFFIFPLVSSSHSLKNWICFFISGLKSFIAPNVTDCNTFTAKHTTTMRGPALSLKNTNQQMHTGWIISLAYQNLHFSWEDGRLERQSIFLSTFISTCIIPLYSLSHSSGVSLKMKIAAKKKPQVGEVLCNNS